MGGDEDKRLPPEFDVSQTIHAADERAPVEALDFGTDAIARVLQRFSGERGDLMTTATLGRTLAVPGPRSPRLVGQLLAAGRFLTDAVGTLAPLFAAYGPVVTLRAGGGTRIYSADRRCPGSIAVYGPEPLRQTRTQHDRFYQHPLVGPLFAKRSERPRTATLNSFLVSLWGVEQEDHRRQRRLMLPAFHRKRIEACRDDMVAITADELAHWHPGETVYIAEEMHGLTLRIVTKTLFGEDAGRAARGSGHDVVAALALLLNPLTTLLPYDLPGLPYRRFLDLVARYDAAMRDLVARKRAAGGDDGDVLSMLLQAHDEESGTALTEDADNSESDSLCRNGHVYLYRSPLVAISEQSVAFIARAPNSSVSLMIRAFCNGALELPPGTIARMRERVNGGAKDGDLFRELRSDTAIRVYQQTCWVDQEPVVGDVMRYTAGSSQAS